MMKRLSSFIRCMLATAPTVVLGFSLAVSAAETTPEAPKPAPSAPEPVAAPKPPQDETIVNAGKNPGKEPDKEGPRELQSQAPGGADLRALIGVNPVGLKRAEVPRLPTMSLRGFVRPHGQQPLALLEMAELNRIFLVQVGTEIPITVAGRLSPVGRGELTGLAKAPAAPVRATEGQSQI